MEFEVLMSVMHQTNFDIAHKTNIKSNLLIINQCDKNDYNEIEVNGKKWRMISTTDRGLAKSRNMAMENALGEICLFCDDDEVLEDDCENTILQAYHQLSDAGSIVFNVQRIGYKMKKKYYSITRIRKAPFYRGYSSQMLTIKLSEIKNTGIKMNEKFGSGTEWGGGEETLFEKQIRNKGIIIYEYPQKIADIHYENGSQWFEGYDEKYFYNLGAYSYYTSNGRFSILNYLMALYICFYKLRRENTLNPFQKLYWMRLGAKGIKNNVTYKQYLAQRHTDKY